MSDDNLRTIYEQYWLHARHQETQRLWFTNIYALIVTGVFAYFGASKVDNSVQVVLLAFLTLLSLFGYLMTYSWNLPFTIYSRLAELISIKEWHLVEDYRRFTRYKKGVRAGRLFVGFYSLMLGVFVALLVPTICQTTSWVVADWIIIVAGTVVFLGFYVFYHFYLDRSGIGTIQKEFEEKVKNVSRQETVDQNECR